MTEPNRIALPGDPDAAGGLREPSAEPHTADKNPGLANTYPLEFFTVDVEIHPRTALSESTIESYAEAMGEGVEFPAIEAVALPDGRCVVADGVHRLNAAWVAGLPEIRAVVRAGTEVDALVAALRGNGSHGLPLGLAERRELAEKIIKARWADADAVIARDVGLTPRTIGRYRLEMAHKGSGPVLFGRQLRRYRKSGVFRTMDVSQIGRKPADVGAAAETADVPDGRPDSAATGQVDGTGAVAEAEAAASGTPGGDPPTPEAAPQHSIRQVPPLTPGELADLLNRTGEVTAVLRAVSPRLPSLDNEAARKVNQILGQLAAAIRDAELAVYGPAFPRGGRWRIASEI